MFQTTNQMNLRAAFVLFKSLWVSLHFLITQITHRPGPGNDGNNHLGWCWNLVDWFERNGAGETGWFLPQTSCRCKSVLAKIQEKKCNLIKLFDGISSRFDWSNKNEDSTNKIGFWHVTHKPERRNQNSHLGVAPKKGYLEVSPTSTLIGTKHQKYHQPVVHKASKQVIRIELQRGCFVGPLSWMSF